MGILALGHHFAIRSRLRSAAARGRRRAGEVARLLRRDSAAARATRARWNRPAPRSRPLTGRSGGGRREPRGAERASAVAAVPSARSDPARWAGGRRGGRGRRCRGAARPRVPGPGPRTYRRRGGRPRAATAARPPHRPAAPPALAHSPRCRAARPGRHARTRCPTPSSCDELMGCSVTADPPIAGRVACQASPRAGRRLALRRPVRGRRGAAAGDDARPPHELLLTCAAGRGGARRSSTSSRRPNWDEREAHDLHGWRSRGTIRCAPLVAHPADLDGWTVPFRGHDAASGRGRSDPRRRDRVRALPLPRRRGVDPASRPPAVLQASWPASVRPRPHGRGDGLRLPPARGPRPTP